MLPEERHAIERAKWDDLARSETLGAEDILPANATFRDWARRDSDLGEVADDVADFLGALEGRTVLEYGCGRGIFATLLARSGARVSAFDISPASVEHTRARAELNGVEVDATVAPAEDLPYADASFERVFGTATLHHVDVERAGPELHRVLAPGGRAVFLEPMGINPLLKFARDRLPYARKTPRGTDRPLTQADIEAWGAPYSEYRVQQFQLISMVERAFGFDTQFPRLRALDRALLERVPALRRYARCAVLYMIK
jgi:SAM-dependent methyltransferase